MAKMNRAEHAKLKEAHACMMEADRRARARGLTPEAIEREVDDDGSQYWDDFREALTDYRERRAN